MLHMVFLGTNDPPTKTPLLFSCSDPFVLGSQLTRNFQQWLFLPGCCLKDVTLYSQNGSFLEQQPGV